jgi:ABC-2 type transport system ATP-binding protein
MAQHALLIDRLTKRYDKHLAVSDLSLAVPAGRIYGILGPNGAGKSSTIRAALNIIARDSGSVAILGVDPAQDRSVLKRVGYLPEERGLYKKMTVRDVIIFFARLKGVTVAKARTEADRWLQRMGLEQWRGAKVDTLSKGMQQKVQFITTVAHEPELLILDEPTAGLDPINQEVMRDTMLSARDAGRTVVFSTHNMDHAEQLCDSVCIIAGGLKLLDGELEQIRKSNRGNRYTVRFDEVCAREEWFTARPELFAEVKRDGDGIAFSLGHGADAHSALACINAMDPAITEFKRVQPSLHQIFVQHVEGRVLPRRQEVAHV